MQDNNFMSDTDLKSMFIQIGKAKEEKARKINNEIDKKAEESRKRRQGIYIEGIDFDESSADELDERSRQIAMEIERIKKGGKGIKLDEDNKETAELEKSETLDKEVSPHPIVDTKEELEEPKKPQSTEPDEPIKECVIEFLEPVFEKKQEDLIVDFSQTISFSLEKEIPVQHIVTQQPSDVEKLKRGSDTSVTELTTKIDNILNQ